MVKKPTPVSLTSGFVLPPCFCDSLLSVSQTHISNVETDNCKTNVLLALPYYCKLTSNEENVFVQKLQHQSRYRGVEIRLILPPGNTSISRTKLQGKVN